MSTTHCMIYHSLLIHLFVDRRFRYFYRLTFVSDIAVNVGVQYLFKSLLSDISPEVECLYHIIILCFISEEPPCCFLKQEYYFAFPPAMQKGSSITNSCYFLGFCLFVFFLFFTFFSNSCPIECEVFHCGFNLHFPND